MPGEEIEPVSPFRPIDEVTGKAIPPGRVGLQYGMVKDTDPRAGSWEKEHPDGAYDIPVYYDPALGVQLKPASDYTDED